MKKNIHIVSGSISAVDTNKQGNVKSDKKRGIDYYIEIVKLGNDYIEALNKIGYEIEDELKNNESKLNGDIKAFSNCNACSLCSICDYWAKKHWLNKSLDEIIDIIKYFELKRENFDKKCKINSLLSKFTERQRQIIILLVYENKSASEIAKNFNYKKVKTVEQNFDNICNVIQNDKLLMHMLEDVALKNNEEVFTDNGNLRNPQKTIKMIFNSIV